MSDTQDTGHRKFCPNNRPNVAYPRHACTSCTGIDWSVSEALSKAIETVECVSRHDFPDIDPLEFDTPFDYAKAICEAALEVLRVGETP